MRATALLPAAALASLLGLDAATAQVVVCQGTSSCVEVDGSDVRPYSDAEVLEKNRLDAIGHLIAIDCPSSNNEADCREKVRGLQSLFHGTKPSLAGHSSKFRGPIR